MQCSVVTAKKHLCTIYADRMRLGVAYCHVHDPEGVFAQQVRAYRGGRESRRAMKVRKREERQQAFSKKAIALMRGFAELKGGPD